MNKIVIPLDNGYKLVAEQNSDSEFEKEIFVGIENPSGVYWQDLAVIRPEYIFKNNHVVFKSNKFELLVYGNSDAEDYTEQYSIGLRREDDE